MGKGRAVTPQVARRILIRIRWQVSEDRVVASLVALHRRPDVVENEQGSSHLTRRVRRVRKLAEPRRIRLGSWNVGSLTGKLRELVDAAVRRGIEVDKAKVDAIEKMPCPKDIKGIRSFLGHASFYRKFIKDFSKKF